jgi:isocitrate/isopropylmalate dehydrogenase
MLEYVGLTQEASAIDAAVHDAVASGQGTAEIGGSLGTRETGDYIAAHIRRTQRSPRIHESAAIHEEPEPDRT